MSHQKTIDASANELLEVAKKEGIETVWDRYEAMKPHCGFGELGVCCRLCWKGPCRIDPFGNGPQRGVCGADAHTIVARNLIRMMAAGAAAHSEHGRHIALCLLEVADDHAPAYSIKDKDKLRRIAERLHLAPEGKDIKQIAREVATATLDDFSRQQASIPCNWAKETMTEERVDRLVQLGVMPHNIDAVVTQIMGRTHVGCDADPVNLLLGGIKGALADYTGMYMATELSDALFGTPQPVISSANLGVLKEDAVNIALHGHNPLLSEVVCDVAIGMNEEAKKAGAKEGINIVGICCTGNEVMMRHNIPLATNYLSQELALVTGAVDALVVDVQCIMPSVAKISECYHTEVITTMAENKIPGATHIQFQEKTALEDARKTVELAIEAFKKRGSSPVHIPNHKQTAIAGFSAEALIGALSKLNAEDPLKPIIDNIVDGSIQGIALFVGCGNPRATQDNNFMTIAKELARNNVMILATGCASGAFAKNGLMTQEATEAYAGDGLKGVLTAVGQAAGLEGPLPLVLHMGSCVDTTRAANVAVAIADKLGVDLDKLPLVASAPEAMSEKAVAIGTWSVALGLPTHIGITPQITGSSEVVKFLTETAKEALGGYFIVETDPVKAADKLFDVIKERRQGLGI
ncbi:Ni-dependent carbon monoxide dehydrogenase precursor [Geothermobacter ehrlichii]|uniref:Carbon monoxide dehydrogenase n=1 Tax=Geothermobacter ehrlichii TaxID=213224 RepID=A0A5D3WKV2_9BACT|nr:anaerobic carbon-monoxide dehydrogenase catalytic subunit [Geothermobacter ehrlichii]TYO98566.1 Ni-dependent carbon monoxide dehydrogenase precursor [Geothermobacter ehrlichii]